MYLCVHSVFWVDWIPKDRDEFRFKEYCRTYGLVYDATWRTTYLFVSMEFHGFYRKVLLSFSRAPCISMALHKNEERSNPDNEVTSVVYGFPEERGNP